MTHRIRSILNITIYVTAIVQPGGSIRDQQVIDTCNKYGIAMAFCGIRLFHH